MVPPHPRGWSRDDRGIDLQRGGSPAPAGMVLARVAGIPGATGFPRTRGDGPVFWARAQLDRQVPPHPRGWSFLTPGVRLQVEGSPAPAGMVPDKITPLQHCPWFPRTRGDGPDTEVGSILGMSVPPHPRGWSLTDDVRGVVDVGSPAPAGMVPEGRIGRCGRGRFPRTRGDGPGLIETNLRQLWVPPHPRGWSRQYGRPPPAGMGSPAPAGMVPRSVRKLYSRGGFPRTRGDGPAGQQPVRIFLEVPPHPRGWSPDRRSGRPRARGSPAPAGMVRATPWRAANPPQFPRTRGDGPMTRYGIRSAGQVPPHPRGWSVEGIRAQCGKGGSPAPAGMVPGARPSSCRSGWFPRTRGDGPPCDCYSPCSRRVPPHPRGWSRRTPQIPYREQGSPAPAGMVPRSDPACASTFWFPRTRGDGPCSSFPPILSLSVPPHPRGWSLGTVFRLENDLGSPAPAGMVPVRSSAVRGRVRFPRTRGDGPTR